MTRTSGKLYLVDPPDIRLKPPPDPVWITPIVDPQPTLSTEAMCRQWLKAEIGALLSETCVQVEDIAHHPYREAYFFKRDSEVARIDIIYRGDWTIANVACSRPSAFAESVRERIVSIVGRKPTGLPSRRGAVSVPTEPFLKAYHCRLVAALASRRIRVVELRKQEFAQRYTFARDSDAVEVNIFYNGRHQMTTFRPANPAPNPGPTLVALQNDVKAVLAEVSP
jgi:hypothetical protein